MRQKNGRHRNILMDEGSGNYEALLFSVIYIFILLVFYNNHLLFQEAKNKTQKNPNPIKK